MTSDATHDDKLAECLEDHHRRRARGEPAAADGCAALLCTAGRAEFRGLLETQPLLDTGLDCAACRAAADAAHAGPRSERAWAAMETALERLELSRSKPSTDAARGRAAAGEAK